MFSLDAQSRVWVYPSNRVLSAEEVVSIQAELEHFVSTWAAHGTALKGEAKVLFNRLIVLAVDGSYHEASGCSIDSSVRIVKDLGKKYDIDFFNRLKIWYRASVESEYVLIPYSELKNKSTGSYLNPLVSKVSELPQELEKIC